MPAYQIEVGGQLDGSTPLVLPSPMPVPADGGVIRLSTAINVGALDLSALTRQEGSPVWIRSLHIEFADGTYACRCEARWRGTAERQLVAPVVSAPDGEPLLMRVFTLNPGAIAPAGSTLHILTDDVGPNFEGQPALGPHFVYLDLVALDIDDDLSTLVQAMTAYAEAKEHSDGDVHEWCQGAAASASQVMGLWVSPIADLVGSNTNSGQLVTAEVTVGTAPAAGESMRVEVFRDFGGASVSLGYVTIDDSFTDDERADIPITLPNNEFVSGTELRVVRTYAAGGAPTPMANTCVRLRTAPTATGEVVGGEADPVQTLRVNYPGSSWLGDVNEVTWEGTFGGTAVGSWHPVSATHYLYLLQDDGTGRFIGVDPGDFEPSLAGMTGVAINIPSGNQGPAAVGTQVQNDWNAAGTGITATYNGVVGNRAQVDFVGVFDAVGAAAAGPGAPWSTRGVGTSAYGATELNVPGVAAINVDWRSAVQVEEAALPVVPFRVVGIRYRGDNLQLAVSINGDGRGNPENSTVQVTDYAAGGGTDWHTHWLTPSQCFEVDGATLDEMFILVDGDGASSGIVGGASQNLGLQLDGSGDNVFRLGANQGALTPMTTPIGPLNGGNFFFGLAVQVVVQVSPFYGNCAWASWGGMSPQIVPTPPNTVSMDYVAPMFAFDFPNVIGLQIQDVQVYLATHDAADDDQLRIESWENAGGLSLLTVTGDTSFNDFGPTVGDDTGWVSIMNSPVDIDGGGEYRISIKGAPLGPANDTSLGFVSGGLGENVGMPGWSLADTMEDSEIEYTAANGETWLPFDPQVATPSPLAPDSAPLFPGNAGGLAVQIGHPGITMVANP